MKLPKIYLTEIQKKGLLLAFALAIFINAAVLLTMPGAQSVSVPFSSVSGYSTSYVTIEPSTEFPIWHWVYSVGFAIIILVIAIFAAVHLSATKNLTSFWSVGAILAMLFCCYMVFASPYSQFAVIPETTSLTVHVQGSAGQPIASSVCYLYVSNDYLGSKSTDGSGNVRWDGIKTAALFQGGCYCPSNSIIKVTFSGTTYTTQSKTVTLPESCIPCTLGQRKCLSNNIQYCVGNTWSLEKACSSTEICECSSSTACTCKTQPCTWSGWGCLDSKSRGYCENGQLTRTEGCAASCSGGECANCESKWKCKDSMTLGYLSADCSWQNIQNCVGGCVTDADGDAHCDTQPSPTTPITTTRTTISTTPITTTPQITTTTNPLCVGCPCGCYFGTANCVAPCQTATTTIPPTTTTIAGCTLNGILYQPGAKVQCAVNNQQGEQMCGYFGYAAVAGYSWSQCVPKQQPIDYLLYGGVGLVLLLAVSIGFIFYKRNK